jgi:hypothetical protein
MAGATGNGGGMLPDNWIEVAKTVLIATLLLICVLVYLLRNKQSILENLNKQTKQMLLRKGKVYSNDPASGESIGISVEILPYIQEETEENGHQGGSQEVIQTRNKKIRQIMPENTDDLLRFLTEQKIRFLVGQGGMGKTSLLLYIANLVSSQPITFRRKHQNTLVQFVSAAQFNELAEENPKRENVLISVIKQRLVEIKRISLLDELNVTIISDAYKALGYLLRRKYIRLFFPKGDWSSFESKRRKEDYYDFKLLLLLDGYDELNKQARDILHRELNQIKKDTNGSVSVIATSRYKPGVHIDCSCDLQPLSEDQIGNYSGENKIPSGCNEILNKPITLTMYCKTSKLDEETTGLPFHKIDSASDLYWNYLCSFLNRSVEQQESLEIRTKKAILLFLVLPRLAMELEAKGDKKKFSLNNSDFRECIRHITENKKVLLGKFNPVFGEAIIDSSFLTADTGIAKWLEEIGVDSKATKFVEEFLKKELSIIDYKPNEPHDLKYSFAHTYYRNFLAAVYRVQRDVATLCERDDAEDEDTYTPYHYAVCEKLPDISLVLRKFYYELIAYHFRNVLKNEQRDSFANNSVRYNGLLSDLHYYGDAENNKHPQQLYDRNYEAALKFAEKAISIGEKRIKNLKNPDEMNGKTDLVFLCWVRWCATHIIQKDLPEPDESQKKRAYEYSKANSLAEGYGEFIGYDKLAAMLNTTGFLTQELIENELRTIPLKDKTGKYLSNSERLRLRWLECLQKGKKNRYHYSFNKHAYWLETELKKIHPGKSDFQEKLNEIYELFLQSYDCKPNDYYALSRIMFYEICYGEYIDKHIRKDMDGLINDAEKSMSKQLSFHKSTELYGYDNFCENAGFWFLIKMLSGGVEPTLGVFEDKINDWGSELCKIRAASISLESAQQAAYYYKKLYVSVYDQLGGSIEGNPNGAKTLCKAVVAYRFIQWVCQNCKEDFRITLEDICLDEKATQLQLKKVFGGKPNKFFREDRYWKLYEILQKHQTVEV